MNCNCGRETTDNIVPMLQTSPIAHTYDGQEVHLEISIHGFQKRDLHDVS